MRAIFSGIISGALLALAPAAAGAQTLPAPAMRPAIDGILAAFQTHALVANVAPDGSDVYRVEFEKAKTEWRISPPIDGKIYMVNFHPL